MQLAWHFLAADEAGNPVLRDGRPLVVGQWYKHDGPLVMCKSGYHASVRALDALDYAPGPWVSLCEIDGTIEYVDDKLVATRRRALWCYDATEVLWLFARQCALDVADLWEMPAVVRQYLETGDGSIRVAAWDAANVAARAAARAAARDAAKAVAWDAARCAERDAARAAAQAATSYAARYAARYAAWYAASVAARDTQNATLESMLFASTLVSVYGKD